MLIQFGAMILVVACCLCFASHGLGDWPTRDAFRACGSACGPVSGPPCNHQHGTIAVSCLRISPDRPHPRILLATEHSLRSSHTPTSHSTQEHDTHGSKSSKHSAWPQESLPLSRIAHALVSETDAPRTFIKGLTWTDSHAKNSTDVKLALSRDPPLTGSVNLSRLIATVAIPPQAVEIDPMKKGLRRHLMEKDLEIVRAYKLFISSSYEKAQSLLHGPARSPPLNESIGPGRLPAGSRLEWPAGGGAGWLARCWTSEEVDQSSQWNKDRRGRHGATNKQAKPL